MYHKFNDTLGEGDFDRSACVWFAFAILCFTPSYTAGGWPAARGAGQSSLHSGLTPAPAAPDCMSTSSLLPGTGAEQRTVTPCLRHVATCSHRGVAGLRVDASQPECQLVGLWAQVPFPVLLLLQ